MTKPSSPTGDGQISDGQLLFLHILSDVFIIKCSLLDFGEILFHFLCLHMWLFEAILNM